MNVYIITSNSNLLKIMKFETRINSLWKHGAFEDEFYNT